MFSGTGMDLDGDVAQSGDSGKPRLVSGRRLGTVRYQRYHSGVVAGSDPPKMKVRHPIIPIGFQAMRDLLRNPLIGANIEQHGTGCSDQIPRPVGDDQHPYDAHYGVQPHPTEYPRRREADQGQYRNRCVSHDVHIGGSEIVIGMMVMMGMVLVMLMHRMGSMIVAVMQ
jgi:hypothetical protein